MLDKNDVLSTVQMIDRQHLDIRTITMGISLLSCADRDAKAACEKIYDKITRYAEGLVKTGEDIEREFGIPIVNKRISVTPIALVAAASETEDYVPFAVALDRARAKGHDRRRPPAHRRHSRGAGRHRPCVLVRQRRLDQGRHQHGRGSAHGPHRQGRGGAHRRLRRLRLREARGVL